MSDNPTFATIQSEIDENPVVLFMKGNPMFPQCGFSAAVVGALTQMQVKFKGIDVLQDSEVREGIKAFSSWPTIPQLYVKGEFVGGCDIIKEMYEDGELQKLFDDKGIEYKAA
ncbi:MAG: Grx4 family monothiol glutaredoxin [Rhodospirillaceae bacterium]|nr:Grx4 family monothiol glutaredoxin [Rhodospirillaceae bacterium]MCK5547058.1 Grx4 family monothiol glutaredoxin [Rhodospirillaceae bacterium]